MSERNMDIDLITALAEGTLPADEAAAAERALTPGERDELELQRAAIVALQSAPMAALTAGEREQLRTGVRQAINLAGDAEPAVAPPPARPWYVRLLPAAAGLAALVLVVGIGLGTLGNFGGGDDADETAAAETADLAGVQTTEAASELFSTAAQRSGAVDDATASDGDEAQVAEAPAAEMGTTIAAAEEAADAVEEETEAGGAFPNMTYAGDFPVGNEDRLTEAMALAGESRPGFPLTIDEFEAFSLANEARCWLEALEAVEDPVELVLGALGSWIESPAELYEFLTEADQVIVVTLAETCEIATTVVR